MKPVKSVQDLAQLKAAALVKFRQRRARSLMVRIGTCGINAGSLETMQAIKDELKTRNIYDISVIQSACSGQCSLEPMVVIYPEDMIYVRVKPEDAPDLIGSIIKGKPIKRLMYRDQETNKPISRVKDLPLITGQVRLAMRNAGNIDPYDIEEYIANDGYAAFAKALSSMTREQVIDEIEKSGLRGRGGAGFSTGTKWRFTYEAPEEQKYVVCNAEEGDPDVYVARSLLEGDPYSIIEAMTIAGYAVGANQGYIYVQVEYQLAAETLKHAIKVAEKYGLLGDNIMGTGFSFHIDVSTGGDAYICGEETSQLASIEGELPEPRLSRPSSEGLWGKPTLVNSVETYASIAPIIIKGGDWFATIGTEKSKGTKVLSLTGMVKNIGQIEVPMGIALGEIINDLGGGMVDGKKFKAALIGGPMGGCIPASHSDATLDFETLSALGSGLGAGGFQVVDEDTCMVDVAKSCIGFCQEESCGKCVPCRIGTKRMLEIVERIANGQGMEGDIETLEKLMAYMRITSFCNLGRSAPNTVLTTIRYFRDEYESHIVKKCCPTSHCAVLIESSAKSRLRGE
jgi:NADH:ubiquinone oxidoreductase subunit F (NADH-binding)/(2Fe-2S) ferredoxin